MDYIQENSSKFRLIVVLDQRVNDNASKKEFKSTNGPSKAKQQQLMEYPYLGKFIKTKLSHSMP